MARMINWDRRAFVAGAGASGLLALAAGPARAQGLGRSLGLSSILGKATDNALDQLAQPGAFYDDENIRIGLPIMGNAGGGLLGTIVGGASKLGVLDNVTKGINDAAGVAAGEAKPIFRDAIDDLSFSDAPGIIKESDGGTQYLRRSSNDRLHSQLEPLVDDALEKLGVYSTFEGLAEKHSFVRSAGLDRQSINKTVTDQSLDGIFSYIGREERGFRKDPLSVLGGLLGK